MPRVLIHTAMSLDGFIAGPGDDIDWLYQHAQLTPAFVDQMTATVGALVAGPRGYQVARRAQRVGTQLSRWWSGPIFILTADPPPDDVDPAFTFVSGDARDAVNAACAAAQGGDVLVVGASIARECLQAGLVDEMLIHILPVLQGGGSRLFSHSGVPANLEPLLVDEAGSVVNLRYRIAK